MKIAIMQPYFFPHFAYFQLISAVDVYINLDHVSFMKRSYMVRNRIKNDVRIQHVLKLKLTCHIITLISFLELLVFYMVTVKIMN